MNFYSKIKFLILIFLLSSCAPNVEKEKNIVYVDQEQEMIEAYKSGVNALNDGDTFFAASKFLEAEVLYPQSDINIK